MSANWVAYPLRPCPMGYNSPCKVKVIKCVGCRGDGTSPDHAYSMLIPEPDNRADWDQPEEPVRPHPNRHRWTTDSVLVPEKAEPAAEIDPMAYWS